MDKFEKEYAAAQARKAKKKQETEAFNRVLCWIVGGVVLEFLLLLLSRYYINYTTGEIELAAALRTVIKIVAVASLAVAVACAVWMRGAKAQGKKYLLPGALSGFALGLSVCCFATWFVGPTGLKSMYVLVPVAIVLAFVYYLYQKEFFLVAVMSALAFMGIWFVSKGMGGLYSLPVYLFLAVAAALLIGAVALTRKLQAGEGVITVKGHRVRLFAKQANYTLIYVSAGLSALVIVGVLAGLPPVLLYAVMAAWTLIMAVYYTVKMM